MLADAEGKHAFNIVLHPDPGSNVIRVSVIMDKVICQRDPVFHGLIQAMRNGDLNHGQADVLLNGRTTNISPEERKKLKKKLFM